MEENPSPEPGEESLDQEFDSLRGALLVHCYQMVGSYHDAEDLVQETYLRARRGFEGFQGRSSVKTWLYRIATNTALTALKHRSRRVLPSGIGVPSDDPDARVEEDHAISWLEPLPDAALAGEGDPADIVVEREAVRLALVAALQYLPGRQRAAFLLREVLGWSTSEIADAMDISGAAVKSLVQRARARLAEIEPELASSAVPVSDAVERELLDRWIKALETADIRAIEKLIQPDFTIEAVPHTTWFQGMAVCVPFIGNRLMRRPGELRMIPSRQNGQPAVASYVRDEAGNFQALSVAVLTVVGDRIARVTSFVGVGAVVAAGLPARLPADQRP